jgi:hypothetical protein
MGGTPGIAEEDCEDCAQGEAVGTGQEELRGEAEVSERDRVHEQPKGDRDDRRTSHEGEQ